MWPDIIDILVPIYVTVGLGFTLGRLGMPWEAKTITALTLQVSFPLLVIHQFTRPGITVNELGMVFIATLIIMVLFLVIFAVLIRLARLPVRTYLAPACLSNMSIGLALGYLGFGDLGFAISLAFASVILLGQFTFGRWFPEGQIKIKRVLKQFFIYALAIGLFCLFTETHLPSYVEKSLHLVGQITIPILLLSLGFALANVHLKGFGKGMLLATVHLAVCLGIGLGVSWALDLKGDARTLVILMSILPSSTINILMGREARADLERITIFVTCTNIWLIVTLPIALYILL